MPQDIPVKEISELLETVSTKVPTLLKNVLGSLYSQEAALEMGKAVGTLYKELVAAGIPEDAALKMTSDYMFSLKDLVNKGFSHGEFHQYSSSK